MINNNNSLEKNATGIVGDVTQNTEQLTEEEEIASMGNTNLFCSLLYFNLTMFNTKLMK